MSSAAFQMKMLHMFMESVEAICQNLMAVIFPKQQLHFQNFTIGLTLVIQMKSLSICHRNEHPQKQNRGVFWEGLKDFKELFADDKFEPGKDQVYRKISP